MPRRIERAHCPGSARLIANSATGQHDKCRTGLGPVPSPIIVTIDGVSLFAVVRLFSWSASGPEQRLQTQPRRYLGLPRPRTERLTSMHAAEYRLLLVRAQRPVHPRRPIARAFDRPRRQSRSLRAVLCPTSPEASSLPLLRTPGQDRPQARSVRRNGASSGDAHPTAPGMTCTGPVTGGRCRPSHDGVPALGVGHRQRLIPEWQDGVITPCFNCRSVGKILQ